ncbi:tripartite tricarboxylate transporter TctB family protein [Chloroflexota bacterium]
MKIMRGSTYFLMVILLVMLVAIYISLQITTFKAQLLPLLISIAIAILALAGLFVEIRKKPDEDMTAKESKQAYTEVKIIRVTAAWLASLLLLIYLIGFPVAIFFFVAAYLKRHGKGWIRSIAWGLGMGIFIYIGFDFLLGVDLHRGVLYIPLYSFLP